MENELSRYHREPEAYTDRELYEIYTSIDREQHEERFREIETELLKRGFIEV
ncbi:MAG: hypothetical protein AAFW89_05615 [Bacteroidota bacterium]